MARTSINRSISFDPDLFSAMEDRRSKLVMERSEYIKRLIFRDLLGEKTMTLTEVPDRLAGKQRKRSARE